MRLTPLLVGLLSAFLAASALGHTRHDDVTAVELSPDFANDGMVLAVTQLSDDILFSRSLDRGRTWEERALPLVDGNVSAIRFSPDFAGDRTVFVSTGRSAIWRSVDGGDSFVRVGEGLGTIRVHGLAVSPDFAVDRTLLAATDVGVARSTDGGDTWVPVNSGLTETDIERVAFAGGGVVFAAGHTLHRSTDRGDSWTPVRTLADDCTAIAPSSSFDLDGTVLVGVADVEGVLLSTDGGFLFTPIVDGLTDVEIRDVVLADDGTAVCIARTDGVFTAAAPGLPWAQKIDGIEPLSPLTTEHYLDLSLSPDFVTDRTIMLSSFMGLFLSEDATDSWRQRDVYSQRINRTMLVSPAWSADRTLLVGNFGGGFILTESPIPGPAPVPSPGGVLGGGAGGPGPGAGGRAASAPAPGPPPMPHAPVSWKSRSVGLGNDNMFPGPMAVSPDFGADGTLYYAHLDMWRSTDRGLGWEKLTLAPAVNVVRGIACSPDFATDHTMIHGTEGGSVFMSTDRGETWTNMGSGIGGASARQFAFSPDWANDRTLFLATLDKGLFRSRDGGQRWTQLGGGLSVLAFRELKLSPDFASDGTVFAGSMDGGLWHSADGGDTWTNADLGLPADLKVDVLGLAVSPAFGADGTAFAATTGQGVYRTTDGARSWQRVDVDLTSQFLRVLDISPSFAQDRTLFVSTHDWIWRSTDAGLHWTRLPGLARVPDIHPQLLYEGPWGGVPSDGVHGESFARSDQPGAAFELEFHGDSIRWHAVKTVESGWAEVWLDGHLEALVDLHAPGPPSVGSVFSRAFPEAGNHELRVLVTGLKSPESGGAFVNSDGLAFTF